MMCENFCFSTFTCFNQLQNIHYKQRSEHFDHYVGSSGGLLLTQNTIVWEKHFLI